MQRDYHDILWHQVETHHVGNLKQVIIQTHTKIIIASRIIDISNQWKCHISHGCSLINVVCTFVFYDKQIGQVLNSFK